MSKNNGQLDSLASSIQSGVQPTFTEQHRKKMELHYEGLLEQLKDLGKNGTVVDEAARQKAAQEERSAEKDLRDLRDADHSDARNLRRDFSKMRREAHDQVRDLARASRKALHMMGSATSLEEDMDKAHRKGYDHAEHNLEDEKDKMWDDVDMLHDQMDDVIENIYSKVHDRLETKINALEEDAAVRRQQRRKALMQAADTLKMSGSMSRVEEKLHFLERAMLSSQQSQEELASPVWIRTNTICTALISVFLVVSLVVHAMQRRSEPRCTNLSQPVLLA